MPTTTAYEFGDVVLVAFPFTDQRERKKRPAVVVSLQATGETQETHGPQGRPQHCGPVSSTQETPERRRGDGRWLETE
jgi:hypothetical protein